MHKVWWTLCHILSGYMQKPAWYARIIEVTVSRHLFNPAHQTSNTRSLTLGIQ